MTYRTYALLAAIVVAAFSSGCSLHRTAGAEAAASAPAGPEFAMPAQESTRMDNGAPLLDPIFTDRPDRTEGSRAVDPGVVQVEWGWTRTNNDDDGVDVTEDAVSEVLLRYGIVENVELRVIFDGQVTVDTDPDGATPSTNESGAGDVSVGGKIRFCEEDGLLPEIGLLGAVSIPTGAISSERNDPSFLFAFSKTLTAEWSLGSNLGVSWASEEDASGDRSTLSQFDYTLVLGRDLGAGFGAYVEWFGNAGLSRQGGPQNSIAAGSTYLWHDDLQLDISGGIGLSEDAEDYYFSIGFSYRIPTARTREAMRKGQ